MMQLWRVDETTFNFRVFNKQFAGLEGYQNRIAAAATAPGNSETFQIIRKEDDPNRIHIKASNGKFLQVPSLFKKLLVEMHFHTD